MPRRFTASAEQLKPDHRYGSLLVSKFINCLMHDGKKSVAERVFYEAMDKVTKRIDEVEEPLDIFITAIENVKPNIEVRSKRVGGATYQVPTPVNPKRQQTLAIRWMLAAARAQKGRPMAQRLAKEFEDAFKKQGTAVTQRENVHRMAEANRAFAHFAH